MKPLILAAGLMLAAVPALAQQANCGVRTGIVEELARKYGEAQRAIGMAGNRLLEIWSNETSGSWTILMTDASGIACVMASGSSYTAAIPEPEGDPA